MTSLKNENKFNVPWEFMGGLYMDAQEGILFFSTTQIH
jgi:hypothetical protein